MYANPLHHGAACGQRAPRTRENAAPGSASLVGSPGWPPLLQLTVVRPLNPGGAGDTVQAIRGRGGRLRPGVFRDVARGHAVADARLGEHVPGAIRRVSELAAQVLHDRAQRSPAGVFRVPDTPE